MRSIAAMDRLLAQVPSTVVGSLRQIDIGRGSEALYRDQLPGVLDELASRARVASITLSSAIEGVVVDDKTRAERIIRGRAIGLRTRSEQELAGYRDALDYLYQEEWQPVNIGLILHIHRLLFAHTDSNGGQLKQADNVVVDRSEDGAVTVRFLPVPAAETEFYLKELVDRYNAAIHEDRHHPVLVTALFALDLLVIHPFEDGNGRVTRAVTNALLGGVGYGVVQYVSLEGLVAESADRYYQALLESTQGWHEGEHDPWPWAAYFAETLAKAYDVFARRAAAGRASGSKQERVRDYVLHHAPMIFRVADVRAALPGVSDQTIRLVLAELRREGIATPDGTGRATAWRRQPK